VNRVHLDFLARAFGPSDSRGRGRKLAASRCARACRLAVDRRCRRPRLRRRHIHLINQCFGAKETWGWTWKNLWILQGVLCDLVTCDPRFGGVTHSASVRGTNTIIVTSLHGRVHSCMRVLSKDARTSQCRRSDLAKQPARCSICDVTYGLPIRCWDEHHRDSIERVS